MTLETLHRAAWGRLKNQSGAFDLPSIMVGVAVVAILTVGVLAAIFGVIPWAQDRAAQQDLGAVHTAEGVAYAKDGGFMDTAALVTAGWLSNDTGTELEARADAKGECYVAVNTSKTGKEFIVSHAEPTPRESTGIDKWCDGSPLGFDAAPIMVSTWNTNAADTCREITLPIGTLTGTADWGDGTTDTKTTHVYADTVGTVKITINGTFPRWGSSFWADANCLVSVDRWGETKTTNLSHAFHHADDLRHVKAIPSTTKNLGHAFSGVDSAFTLGKLNTTSVTDMQYMFTGATAFNQPLSFDTANVTDMRSMFSGTASLNSPIEFTDTKNVTSMHSMFSHATVFDQPLNFDTKNVTSMQSMFSYAAAFDSLLTFTDTQNVTNMTQMFQYATAFDQPLNFDTQNVATMHNMFGMASSFDHPLDFNTAKVASMYGMFFNAKAFNQDISGWTVDEVTNWTNFRSVTSALTNAHTPAKFR